MPNALDSEFGDDPGTLWQTSGSGVLVANIATSERTRAKELRKRSNRLPIVWIVDDERDSRGWFVANHHQHYALVTFSSREHVVAALQAGLPCDLVVTDIFFPAKLPSTADEETTLLRIYDEIENTTIAGLDKLWAKVRPSWQLLGFAVARDVAAAAIRRKEKIPIVLYSRKAPLLLGDEEWLSDPDAVRATHWMTEKIDPTKTGDVVRKVADIQRNRINALLLLKRNASPLWMRALAGVGLKIGPFQYSLAPFQPK